MSNLNLDDAKKFCVFHSNDSWFGLPCLKIHRIIPRPQITVVPYSDPILRGVCHAHNEFIPIASLRSLLGASNAPEGSSDQEGWQDQAVMGPAGNIRDDSSEVESQLMILPGPQGSWGLLIDRAVGLADLETSYISSFAPTEDHQWSTVVVGSASYANHVLQVLDPDAIYRYVVHLLEDYWLQATELETAV